MIKLFNKMIGNVWTVRLAGFPYPSGYCTYNKYRKTVLDTGLTKEEATLMIKELNG